MSIGPSSYVGVVVPASKMPWIQPWKKKPTILVDFAALEMDGAMQCTGRTGTNAGSRNPGGRRRLVRAGDAIVEESACGVGQHIKAVLGKPVIVPVPLVGTVAGVADRLPLVFVV